MQNDRQITITTGSSRKTTSWSASVLFLSELWEKLKTPMRSTETLAEYMELKKPQQDELKDIGGFVGGALNGPRRKANNVAGRDIITLDLDSIPAAGTENVIRRIEALGCGYCVYSTRKHQPAAPRLRVLLPLDRTVSADEYEPIARKMAGYIGLELADPTTFEVSRLMYWPSCCSDSEYVYLVGDKPFVSADGVLAQYTDWRDMTLWPALPGQRLFTKLAVKQGDPESKNGIVGAFCRTYDICRAMDELLPGIYEPVDTAPGRYTYLGGSTTGGAVLYDDGKFLYSHHATDPCSGKLVNAFDLVRLHKFGDKDDEAQAGTPSHRVPSYTAMREFANSLADVSATLAREDFAGSSENADSLDWTERLTRNQNGDYQKTMNNLILLLQNVPELNGCAKKDLFSGRLVPAAELPWDRQKESSTWTDADLTELRRFLEKWFKPSKQDVKDAVVSVAEQQAFHPIRDYLTALVWDHVPRLDTLFIDYLGAEDTAYTRAVTRKTLVGAIARVMTPGCKFDYMTVFIGKQGRNKSSLISILAGRDEWFADSLATFDGSRAFEAITGKWLVEVPEMQAFDKATLNQAKAFISKQSDFYRAAYAEFPRDNPRQCVFFGTTNDHECLRDPTGGRRFWIIDIDKQTRSKNVFIDLPQERDQVWAEAFVRWQAGEPLFLSAQIESSAREKQEEHREASAREGIVCDFLMKEIPDDWNKWSLDQRRMFWSGTVTGGDGIRLVPRERVCAVEVWCEAFGGTTKDLRKSDTRDINEAIASTPGWERAEKALKFGPYGAQRGFVRG